MKWQIDNTHSSVEFSARHMMISTVKGHFTQFTGEVEADPADLTRAQVSGTIQTASLTTGNEQRDGHLRSDDFFNTEKYPEIKFKSTKIEKKSEDTYLLTGDLTIRDVTKPITLEVEYTGKVRDPYGNDRLGFNLRGSLNRKEYNLNWSALLETGGAVVSEKVNINIDAEVMRPAETPAATA